MGGINQLSESTKHAVDGAAGIIALGTIAKVLPPLAALFTILWLSIQMGEWVWKKIKLLRGAR